MLGQNVMHGYIHPSYASDKDLHCSKGRIVCIWDKVSVLVVVRSLEGAGAAGYDNEKRQLADYFVQPV